MIFKPPSESTRELLEQSTQEYQDNLAEAPAVLEYLTKERSLTSEALDYFRIGYTGSEPQVGDPKNRISIPYNSWGGITQIRFRSLDPDPPGYKYLGSAGSTTTLYNTLALREPHQTVYLVEGEIDTITGWMCGLPVVGCPGSESWKKTYWRVFRYRTVIVLRDGDSAGEKFAGVVQKDIESCKIVSMGEKEDLNSFYCKHGREAVRNLVGLK